MNLHIGQMYIYFKAFDNIPTQQKGERKMSTIINKAYYLFHLPPTKKTVIVPIYKYIYIYFMISFSSKCIIYAFIRGVGFTANVFAVFVYFV